MHIILMGQNSVHRIIPETTHYCCQVFSFGKPSTTQVSTPTRSITSPQYREGKVITWHKTGMQTVIMMCTAQSTIPVASCNSMLL